MRTSYEGVTTSNLGKVGKRLDMYKEIFRVGHMWHGNSGTYSKEKKKGKIF